MRIVLVNTLCFCALALANSSYAAPNSPLLDPQLAAPVDPLAYYARLQEAKLASDAGRFADAENLYRQLTVDYALDRETWVGLGSAYRKQNKHAQAIAAYRHAIELIGPVPGSSRYWTAVSQAALADNDAALDTLETMVFQDRELDRPGLQSDPSFAALQNDPRMKQISGYEDLAKLDRVAGWRTDLDYLVAEIKRLSPDHRQAGIPAETETIRSQLYAQIPQLSDQQIYAGMARLTGSLQQGHTMMWGAGPGEPGPDLRIKFSWLPLLFHAFPEGIYIVGADAQHQDLIGMKVLSLDGVAITDAMQEVRSATSFGSPMEALWTVPTRLAEIPLLRGLGIGKDPDVVLMSLQTPDGKKLKRAVTATTKNPRSKLPKPPGVTAPRFLRSTDQAHWHEVWAERKTVYVQINQMAPDPDESLPQFGIRLRQILADSKAETVVLDLRHNNGGDTFSYVELLRTLVSFSVPANRRLYVLIGRNVYSAAANFSTDLERLAKPIFVGEPTSMTGNQHGDEGAVRLPWSGLRATISGVRWQLSHPWDLRRSIAPKVPVQLSAKAYFAGSDPALDAVEKMIEAHASVQ